jgi:hypothetical protein
LFFDMVRIHPARQVDRWQAKGAAAGPARHLPHGSGAAGSGPLFMLMRATGRGSISSILKLAVDVIWVLACAFLGFIWIIAAASIFSLATGGAPFLGIEQIAFDSPLKWAVTTLNGSILCIGAMVVCAYLRGVFETLVNRDPFVPENARRFGAIAIVLAVMEGTSMFLTTLISPLLSVLGLMGAGVRFVFPNINWPIWIAVVTLLVLAQVFREGAALREEQKMTI